MPALSLQARVLESAGRSEEAAALAEELLSVWPQRCPTSYWVADLAFTLRDLGRPASARRGGRGGSCGQPLAGGGRRGLGR